MNALIFACFSLAHCALFIGALRTFLIWRSPGTVPLLLVTAGLVYDNAIIAIGGWLGEGTLLAQLSVPRFFLHAMTTPLLILSGLAMVQRTGARWSRRPVTAALVASLTMAMIVIGFADDMLNLTLDPQREGGLLSYGNANADGVPVAPFVTIAVLVAAGLIVWKKDGIPWLALGALAQLAASALGDFLVVLGNLGEVLLLAGLAGTDFTQMCRRQAASRPTTSTGTV